MTAGIMYILQSVQTARLQADCRFERQSLSLPAKGFNVGKINLIVGGQTAFPIRNVTVEEGMKQAFQNVDVYLGVVAEVGGWFASARAWVLVPKIVETNFRKGGGWGLEFKVHWLYARMELGG